MVCRVLHSHRGMCYDLVPQRDDLSIERLAGFIVVASRFLCSALSLHITGRSLIAKVKEWPHDIPMGVNSIVGRRPIIITEQSPLTRSMKYPLSVAQHPFFANFVALTSNFGRCLGACCAQ